MKTYYFEALLRCPVIRNPWLENWRAAVKRTTYSRSLYSGSPFWKEVKHRRRFLLIFLRAAHNNNPRCSQWNRHTDSEHFWEVHTCALTHSAIHSAKGNLVTHLGWVRARYLDCATALGDSDDYCLLLYVYHVYSGSRQKLWMPALRWFSFKMKTEKSLLHRKPRLQL